MNDFVNILDFGAKGDGITDDTQAIQESIQQAIYLGINRVYIPFGTFLLNSFTLNSNRNYLLNYHLLLESNIEIFGNGENSILKRGNNLFDKPDREKNAHIFYGSNLHNVTLRDFSIDLNGSNNLVPQGIVNPNNLWGDSNNIYKNHMALRVDGGSNLILNNLKIKNCAGMNMVAINRVDGQVNSNINCTNCTFLNGGNYVGNEIQNKNQIDFSFIYFEWDYVNIENNHIEQENLEIGLQSYCGGIEIHGSFTKVINNTIIGCFPGMYISSQVQPIKKDILIKNNNISNCLMGINLWVDKKQENITIEENDITLTYGRNRSLAWTSVGIICPGGNKQNDKIYANNNIIDNLKIKNNQIISLFPDETIYTSVGMTLHSIYNSEISNNTISGINYAGIRLEGSTFGINNLDIFNNKFLNYKNNPESWQGAYIVIDDVYSINNPTSIGFKNINIDNNIFIGQDQNFLSMYVVASSKDQNEIYINNNLGADSIKRVDLSMPNTEKIENNLTTVLYSIDLPEKDEEINPIQIGKELNQKKNQQVLIAIGLIVFLAIAYKFSRNRVQ